VAALARHATLAPVAVSRRPCGHPAGVECRRVASYEQTELPPDADLVHLAETAGIGRVGDADVARDAAVFEALLARLSGHAVYASSAAVYGDASAGPHRPDEALQPSGAYAALKLGNERAALARGGTVLRFANLFGPGMTAGTVIDDVMAQLGGSGPVAVRDKSPVRDFLWIDDAASAVVAALETRAAGVFNVGLGRSIAVNEIVRSALAAGGEAGRGVTETAPNERTSVIRLDIGETERRLGWRPRMAFDDGMRALISIRRKTETA
jgi:nucleoside-diphosphate-sugar epimerase